MKFLIYHPYLTQPDLPDILKNFGSVEIRGQDEPPGAANNLEDAGFDGVFVCLDTPGDNLSSWMESLDARALSAIEKKNTRLFILSGKKELVSTINFFKRDGITALDIPVDKQYLEEALRREYAL